MAVPFKYFAFNGSNGFAVQVFIGFAVQWFNWLRRSNVQMASPFNVQRALSGAEVHMAAPFNEQRYNI